MRLEYLVLDIGILSISSYIITWFFAIYLRLSAIQLFFVFLGFNAFNSILQTYLLPFRYLKKLHDEIEEVQLFGFAIFAFFTGVLNLGLLLTRFDWLTSLGIGLGSFLGGPLFYGVLAKVMVPK